MSDRVIHLRHTVGHARRERGTVLIVVMIVVFAVAAMALVLGRSMRAEAMMSANHVAAAQASAIARGAEQYVLALLSQGPEALDDMDERDFEQIAIGEGYFWILMPDYNDPTMPIFGVVDESSKLDLNTATFEVLQRLPGMTDELAASIIDWRDADDEPTGTGAESAVYLALPEPYRAKNAPFETVEELLLVHGMTHELLYGQGASLPLGDAASLGLSSRPFASEHFQRRGLFDAFTVWSRQRSSASSGQSPVRINGQRSELRRLIRETYGETRGEEIIGRMRSGNYRDIFDFARTVELTQAELDEIETRITDNPGEGTLRGRVNVNRAPREVLLCLEGLESGDVDALLARRPSAVAAKPGSIAWVMDVLQEKSIGVGTQITGRGGQYSADVVSVSGNGRAFKRIRIVVDATSSTPRIVYRRDQSELGWPLDPLILESLRAGTFVSEPQWLGARR